MICLFSSIIIITWNIRAVEHINSYFKLLILFDYALRIWRFTVGFIICILCIVGIYVAFSVISDKLVD